jgi:hypothetical protein
MLQAVFFGAVFASDRVGKRQCLSAPRHRAFLFLCYFLVIGWITISVNMSIPGDIWVFNWIEANPLSTEWADEDSDILHICIWALVCCITSVLKTKDMVAAVAGEGEEVDLVAVADAAVLPQVGELRRAHTSGGTARALR